jgi:hypothetical protein
MFSVEKIRHWIRTAVLANKARSPDEATRLRFDKKKSLYRRLQFVMALLPPARPRCDDNSTCRQLTQISYTYIYKTELYVFF